VRRDAMESLKVDEKKKEISEDDRKRSEEAVQKLTDQFVKETDEAAAKKEQEILTQ
jgi:ribosome recycling factor